MCAPSLKVYENHIVLLLFVVFLLVFFGVKNSSAETVVDLQLVLAVDTSGSIDRSEFKLQLAGIAAAFRDDSVISAIQSGVNGQIAVSLVLWSDPEKPQYATDWFVLAGSESAEAFADLVEKQPLLGSGGTGIGRALEFSINHFEGNGLKGGRRVIDISGDGPENLFGPLSFLPRHARHLAISRDVTINALVILTDHPDLDEYYHSEVITGDDAFVITVEDLTDFKEAMRRKLLREISTFIQFYQALPRRLAGRK